MRPALALLLSLLSPSFGCSDEGEPRAQLVVVIDSDAPVVGQLAFDPELSPDAAIDTVRIDAVGGDGLVYALREVIAPEVIDWPISLGVAAPAGPGSVRLRIRAFRGIWAAPGDGGLEPFRETAIDRLLDIALPTEEVRVVRVLLSLDCMGVSPSFLDPAASCVDAQSPAAPPSSGVEVLAEAPGATRVGTSPTARAEPCRGAPPHDGALCIPGGFTVLGDRRLIGVGDLLVNDPFPFRPVRVSPFWLDRTELTVGRFRALLREGGLLTPLPTEQDPTEPLWRDCSWLGPDRSEHDDWALSCLGTDTADEVCARFGGRLPSEAQWEHAARGRGERRAFPWGDEQARCCIASAGRAAGPCSFLGPEPVASHLPSESCPAADVSRDGVVDMGGGLMEYMRDDFAAYGESCWAWQGVAHDPVCVDPDSGRTCRGGSWESPLAQAAPSLRRLSVYGPGQGFRCAYEDVPP